MTSIVAVERLSVKAIGGYLIYFLPCSLYVPVYARSTTTLGPCYQQWHHEDVLASFKQPTNCHHPSLHCLGDREHPIEPESGHEE